MARKKVDPFLAFDLRLTRLEKRMLATERIIDKIYALAEKIKAERKAEKKEKKT